MYEPKILLLDIETAGVNALKPDLGFVICFGWKWYKSKAVNAILLTQDELRRFDDKRLLIEASALIAEADFIVGHYASRFDKKFLQGRLLINGLQAIPPTKVKDTWELARRTANFSSNRLKHLAKILGLKNQKLENNWPVAWFRVMQGDMKALKGMGEYCKGDVLALEELYTRLVPHSRPTDLKMRLFGKRELRSGRLGTPCWIWTGTLRNGRYGQIVLDGHKQCVHRVAYTLFVGEVPDNLELDHLCMDSMCFNPKHLEPVTHQVNMSRVTRGNIAKTVCLKGHPLDVTRIRAATGNKRRECSICVRERQRQRRRKGETWHKKRARARRT